MSVAILGSLIIWLIIAVIVIAIVVYFVNWLYRRSSKELSFVRTGLFGEKVVINSGAFVLPFIHEVTPVNMNVLRMQVVRNRDDALITKDRMRVDIEFGVLCAGAADAGGGDHRRRYARPAHHERRRPRCAPLRQVRLGAAFGRVRDDDGGNARTPRRVRHPGQGIGPGRPGAERARGRSRWRSPISTRPTSNSSIRQTASMPRA